MFGVLHKALKATRIAFIWNNALDATSNKEYTRAYSLLGQVYDGLGVQIPSQSASYDVNLLCGNVCCKIERYETAVNATKIALSQIERDKKLRSEEKMFLSYYAWTILLFCSTKMKSMNHLEGVSPVDYSSLQLDKVRVDIKERFPVSAPIENR